MITLTLVESSIDRIDYDVTVKYLTYNMAFVRTCAVENKPGMLRAALMYPFGRA